MSINQITEECIVVERSCAGKQLERVLSTQYLAINARLFLIEELYRCMRLVSSVSPDQFSKTLALLN